MGNMGVASFTRCRIPHLIAALTCVAKTYSVLCYAAAPLVLMNIALFGQSPDVCYSTVRSSATAVTVHSPTTLPMVVVTKPPRIQAGCIRRRLDARVAMMVRVGRSSDLWIIPEPPMPSQLGVASGLVQGSVPTHRCAPVPVLHRIPMKPYTHLWLHQLASECDAKYSTLGQHAYTYSHE